MEKDAAVSRLARLDRHYGVRARRIAAGRALPPFAAAWKIVSARILAALPPGASKKPRQILQESRSPGRLQPSGEARDRGMPNLDTLETEVVVIGSGPGGSVTAHLLAERGKDVLILEEGPNLPLE